MDRAGGGGAVFNGVDHRRMVELGRITAVGYHDVAALARCVLALEAEFVELRDQRARDLEAITQLTGMVSALSAKLVELCAAIQRVAVDGK